MAAHQLGPAEERGPAPQDFQNDEELVRLLLNSTGEGVYGTDLQGNCTFANPACLAQLGFEKDSDVMGKHMHDLVHFKRPNGDPYPVEECQIYRAFTQSEGVHVDTEIMIRADGTEFPAEYWSYPVEREGELVGCVVTFVDITERRRVEAELRQTDDLVRLLLDSTGEGIYGVDLEGNCTFANPACARILGFKSDADLLGKQMHELVHHTLPNGDPYAVEDCQIYRAFWEHEGTHTDEEVMFCSDGTSFPAEYWSFPVERDGELVGCVVTFVDISERRKIEAEMRQTEKMAALGKLSAGLAHELNNPAAAAGRASGLLGEALVQLQVANVDLARAGLEDEHWESITRWYEDLRSKAAITIPLSGLDASDREEELLDWLESNGVDDGWEIAPVLVKAGVENADLDTIASEIPAGAIGKAAIWLTRSLEAQDLTAEVSLSSERISTLVNSVKSYSYMDQAPVQTIDVHTGLEDTITILAYKLKQGVEVVREYDRNLPQIRTHASELNEVWTNLMDNSIMAMDGTGTITIKTYPEGDGLTVEIGDNGPGIPESARSKIFDPFFTTKDVGEGTGMGLDVVRRIVTQRCNGEIDFESEPGKTVFFVRLPMEIDDRAEEEVEEVAD